MASKKKVEKAAKEATKEEAKQKAAAAKAAVIAAMTATKAAAAAAKALSHKKRKVREAAQPPKGKSMASAARGAVGSAEDLYARPSFGFKRRRLGG